MSTIIGLMAIVLGLATEPSAEPAREIVSRYTASDDRACREHETGEALGQDWVLQRCTGEGGIDVWMLFQDSARVQIAFGPNDFQGYRVWSQERSPDWPIEWRGERNQTPFAAITRVTLLSDEDTPTVTKLAVFRVWQDRSSCFLGEVETNQAARIMADGARTMTTCPAGD